MNFLKKSDLVQNILHLKINVFVDVDLHKLCEKIEKLTDSISKFATENKKLESDLVIVKEVSYREGIYKGKDW